MPALFETAVRWVIVGVARTAFMSVSGGVSAELGCGYMGVGVVEWRLLGMPQTPKPPQGRVSPLLSDLMASSGVTTLDLYWRRGCD